ncbi:orotidine 5'-phosphate decarboxylase [Thioalkalivibrio sulfidiphilus HL-EbGr7]|uniref:Orotidine 5'-phosphate decarboxylase n=1 Tax=Thioalkalivibrio sulfidiphilus (strain HL-EbGR7) TaxID=396588 RepID=B8GRS7_THISH|nr:orotidine-5'-phosphate decarboxylase [Thioalkalivibrio sulfidiphilus]ACL72631.1 orotidine 5'-phosphate decarboxylase [Thioalkalivibrio sulfidiphilus HL-EbGr7]
MPAIYNDPRIIIALDFPDAGQALEFTARLDPAACRLKVGFELFVSAGPALVEKLVAAGFDVFLDLKFHDIPNTVASACRAAAQLGVWMMNVHASGGGRMLQAAREALDGQSHRPRLIAVTVLTSMDERDLDELGLGKDVGRLAEALAGLAAASGLDGVVCSASEAPMLRQRHGEDFLLVTPGIRPRSAEQDDQRRVMTPAEAIRAGSSYLVVGRPITRADSPMEVLEAMNAEIRGAHLHSV